MEHFQRYWSFVKGIHRSPVDPPHKGQLRGALKFLICAWTKGWANNRDADDLRRHRAHYDVAVMKIAHTLQHMNWKWQFIDDLDIMAVYRLICWIVVVTKMTTNVYIIHNMEMLSASLALCEEKPPVTGGFLTQRASGNLMFLFMLPWKKLLTNSRVPGIMKRPEDHVTSLWWRKPWLKNII